MGFNTGEYVIMKKLVILLLVCVFSVASIFSGVTTKAVKEVAEELVELLGKKGMKEFSSEIGEKLAKEGMEEIVEKVLKESGEEAGERLLKIAAKTGAGALKVLDDVPPSFIKTIGSLGDESAEVVTKLLVRNADEVVEIASKAGKEGLEAYARNPAVVRRLVDTFGSDIAELSMSKLPSETIESLAQHSTVLMGVTKAQKSTLITLINENKNFLLKSVAVVGAMVILKDAASSEITINPDGTIAQRAGFLNDAVAQTTEVVQYITKPIGEGLKTVIIMLGLFLLAYGMFIVLRKEKRNTKNRRNQDEENFSAEDQMKQRAQDEK